LKEIELLTEKKLDTKEADEKIKVDLENLQKDSNNLKKLKKLQDKKKSPKKKVQKRSQKESQDVEIIRMTLRKLDDLNKLIFTLKQAKYESKDNVPEDWKED
jgi:hypothetical protein